MKLFQSHHDSASGKCHSWPHVRDGNQNPGTLKLQYRTSFKLHVCVWNKCTHVQLITLAGPGRGSTRAAMLGQVSVLEICLKRQQEWTVPKGWANHMQLSYLLVYEVLSWRNWRHANEEGGAGRRREKEREEEKDSLATALARKSSRNPGCITRVLEMALSWTTLLPECLLNANI